jgi:Transposase IS66 family
MARRDETVLSYDSRLGRGQSNWLTSREQASAAHRMPADNNAAERSVRPIAVRRKISGGTRSAAGSLTRTVLWTLVDTFHAQGKHLLDAWMALLRNPALASV